jgi:hypothetical protein
MNYRTNYQLISILALFFVASGLGVTRASAAPSTQVEVLSLEVMMAQANEYEQGMAAQVKEAENLAKEANSEKDVVKLNCLNSKIEEMKGHMTTLGQSMSLLRPAIASKDAAASSHQHSRIMLLAQKIQLLLAEGRVCVGAEDMLVVAKTLVTTTKTGVPSLDLTQPAGSARLAFDRNPHASRYK